MERLTKVIDSKVVFPSELIGKTMTPDDPTMYALLCRLAAYEDTGLTPEKVDILSRSYPKMFDMVDELNEYRDIGTIKHLRKLVKAEQGGRLVALPPDEVLFCCGDFDFAKHGRAFIAYRRRPDVEESLTKGENNE